jgi:tyrosyl-tRNA synthetase
MNPNEKLNLIVDGLDEIIGETELINILKERDLKVYWGTATTGKPHIGYLKPLLKICHFLKAECEVTILFADLHAYLDAMKSEWTELKFRTIYYEELIKKTLEILGAPIDKLKFIKGSDYQLSPEYTLNMYTLMSKMSLHDAIKSGAEVVKQSKDPKMASLLYPGLQALDEQFLEVDAQFGGVDQRKIFMLADKYLPKLGYKKRIHLMNPMISSFNNNEEGKMSSSEDNKIDLLDNPKKIKRKIGKAYCEEGNIKCGLMEFIEHVLFPLCEFQKKTFLIKRKEEYGGNCEYTKYTELENDFIEKNLHPGDLKKGVTEWLVELLEPVRNHFEDEYLEEISHNAY